MVKNTARARNIARYYVWEQPIGSYSSGRLPGRLGASEGYSTLAQARKGVMDIRRLEGTHPISRMNIRILKVTVVDKGSKKGKKKPKRILKHAPIY